MATKVTAVHPHACGENFMITLDINTAIGSPPRLWGKLVANARVLLDQRFTPTLVGKTNRADKPQIDSEVHPHACGENPEPQDSTCQAVGSPPRLWGKRTRHISKTAIYGFTPTLVGKTASFRLNRLIFAVHPHACGENHISSASSITATGSPPRLWGKPGHVLGRYRLQRFTPTLVGKTLRRFLHLTQ